MAPVFDPGSTVGLYIMLDKSNLLGLSLFFLQ